MTAPVSSNPSSTKSRRALLAGALGGIGAWAASAVGRASPVRAEGEIIHVGDEYETATSRTRLQNLTTNADVFEAETNGTGAAIRASSISGVGIVGSSYAFGGQAGVVARGVNNGTGLLAHSGGATPAAKAKTGVYGEATQDNASRGVWGHSSAGNGVYGSSSSGVGVRGSSTSAQGVVGVGPIGVEGSSSNQFAWGVGGYNSAVGGTGVWGQANDGYAFRGVGRLRLDSVSGVATIAAGNTTKTVSPGVDVTSNSFVLLTPKANIGSRALWFTTNATDNKFTIRMSSGRSSNTKVAWLLLG